MNEGQAKGVGEKFNGKMRSFPRDVVIPTVQITVVRILGCLADSSVLRS